MNANDAFKAGALQDAITAQLETVKNNPTDAGARTFLFELLAFAGEFDRAGKQLEVLRTGETEHDLGVTYYEQLLRAEGLRARLFSESLEPKFFSEDVPEHVQSRLKALQCVRDGQMAEAKANLTKANEQAPALQGSLNQTGFTEILDCDDRFGDVLEVMFQGAYYWLPLSQVAKITIQPPRFPRDLLWAPAEVVLKDEQVGQVFLPALYPASATHDDEKIRLGRQTDWQDQPEGLVFGVGQRTFLVGEEAMGLLEWRELTFS